MYVILAVAFCYYSLSIIFIFREPIWLRGSYIYILIYWRPLFSACVFLETVFHGKEVLNMLRLGTCSVSWNERQLGIHVWPGY
ncbi:hypothetical protein BO86DRAFT_244594 [Aspergillus japonicus CBS 114.51]|uniref:Uncharacterized protein n=1 Tax=Aspergillus japonicus CBS 114.51 TaxID=1448312 RepID=A0A8T8X8Z5_ASPJA|nr:hypothetical protein BO86DRAFT_244594 [Aspergillus japonicus CBS 114.51]RAH84495.1 hypothetical protein BO86DRAFT_244594 [Aspergillus japonicus CBS 114.51]